MNTPSSSADVVNDHHYRLVYFSNELPSDEQIGAHLRRLQALSKDRRHPILKVFLDDATDVLRQELRKLPSNLLSLIAPFESIIDFAYQFGLRTRPFGGSTEGVFTCLIQLGTYISYHENPTNDPLTSPNGTLVALGSGLLAAAAVSFASRLPDLVKLGAEAIRIAFRMGLRVDQVSQRLEARRAEGPAESWAYVFSELSEDEVQKELATINASLNFPKPSQIFVSAVSPGSVTISGPPSRLKTLVRSSELLRYAKWAPLPVFAGLCHSAHVYTYADAEAILSATQLPTNSSYAPHTPLLSTRDGRPFAAQTPAQLFEDVIFELLTGTIRWDTVTATLHDRVALQFVPEVSVKALGAPNALKGFNETIQAHADPVRINTEDILVQSLATPLPERAPRDSKDSKIAIVGMSCRLPGGAVSNQSFWDLLEKGLDVHRRIPADRFDVDTHWDPTGQNPNASKTPFGCFIDDPALFDAGFFNMSPREAEQTDPMHRLALVTAHEALEQAGFVPNRTPSTNLERVGVFYGQASDDYREVNAGQEIGTYYIPGGNRAFAPGRINYFYKFGGPSFSCDTACSSSLATVQIACTTLWSGDADMVIAGGVNVLTNSDGFAGLCNGHFLTQTGNCKTWDASADGYCRADGIGSVVMKRYEDAIADNDNILATVLSAATNQSAKAVSITHPHAGAQASLYKRVMDRAGVDPLDVSYVELHGTGTQAGDATEMESVTEVFAPMGPRRRTEPLHIGAVKSNIGHGEAAAGIAALIKVLLMYRKRSIPPHTGIKTELSPVLKKFLDKKRNIHIALEQTPWTPLYNTRYAVVNNFSAAGGNTTMLLEEAPVKEIQENNDDREKHIVAVSAKSKVSLKGNLEALLAYLEENPETPLSDLAYTTSARRMHYNHRIAFSASSIDQVKKQLRSHIGSEEQVRPVPSNPPAVAFAFTGQGAFYPGMGAQLYHSVPSFREHLVHLDSLCQQHGFPSILPVIENEGDEAQEEPAPIVTQLTITCLEIALTKYWASLGITPSVVVGASLGEYPALHAAGVLSASDTIFLVGQRAQQLEKHCQLRSHGMMAVRASVEQIAECLVDHPYEVACINAPQDTVIDGLQTDITSAREKLQAQGYKCHQLDVPYAFHSSQMDPALDSYEQIASSVTFHAPQVPIISPLLSDVVFDAKTIHAKYMRRATREPVNFVGALQAAQEIGIIDHNTVWVEAGPHPVLVSFIRNCLPEVKRLAPTLRRNENNWNTLADSLAGLHSDGLTLQWNEVHRPFETSLQLLDLPSYSWNEKRYWIQYRGTWALTKGKEISQPVPSSVVSTLTTSSIHQVLQEDVTGSTATFVARSNLMHPDLFEAANGHRMNDCGVATSSIHGDIAFTIADHLYKKITNMSAPGINITNLTVLQGLVAQKFSKVDQLFELRATADLTTSPATTTIHWYNVNDGITNAEHFASAVVEYGDATIWLSQWHRLSHLVKSRIASLERMASEGTAAVLPRNMAYRLFNNLVDYADKYRGIQSVIMHEYEAVANVTLTTQGTGTWTVPPYFTDPVAHLAGLIMNGSDASNTIDYFYVTPGWAGLRFAKPLVKGGKYQSYVQMTPIEGQAGFWNGDVYVLQDGEIIGLVEKITFRRFPRSLLPTFFSPPDVAKPLHAAAPAVPVKPVAPAAPAQVPSPASVEAPKPAAPKPSAPAPVPVPVVKSAEPTPAAAPAAAQNPTITSALDIIAKETALEQSQLTDDAAFATLGVDSLMSLVLAEKFTSQLGIEVKSSIFMECETVGELKTYIEETFC